MATATLLHHYVEYLCSPGILLTLMVVIVPILLGISLDRAADTRQPNRVAGCRRLGLRDRSNLDDQYTRSPPSEQAKPRIKALFTYPIKSCRGVELQASEVDASGLRYDRLFTFAQLVSKPAAKDSSPDGSTDDRNTQWRFITQREFPLLALVKTELWVPDIRGRSTTVATHMSNRDHDKSTVADGQLRPRSRTRGNTLVGQLEHGGKSSFEPITASCANRYSRACRKIVCSSGRRRLGDKRWLPHCSLPQLPLFWFMDGNCDPSSPTSPYPAACRGKAICLRGAQHLEGFHACS